jgi:lipid A 3-O-deacylase
MALRKQVKMKAHHLTCLSAGLLMAGIGPVRAQDVLTVGTRGGASFDSGQNRFWQTEAFADSDLPWKWNFCSDWRFQPRVDVSAGWLEGEHSDAFAGTVGPMVELRKGTFPLVLEGGSSPTILSRDRFGARNFGERFQFTSHIGLTWYITKQDSLGYRFQHMSNAGISQPNPGLNLQMLELSYRF